MPNDSGNPNKYIEIVKTNNEIAVCPCGSTNFKTFQSYEFEDVLMAFCVSCKRGKSVELWQQNWNVGFVQQSEYVSKFESAKRHGE